MNRREFESDTHIYWTEPWNESRPRRYQRIVFGARRKKDGSSPFLLIPVDDCAVAGDLLASAFLECSGFSRMEVTPDELCEEDVIEGLGPILEIEKIPGMSFDMLKVMVQTIPKPDGDGVTRGTVSILFSQENDEWPSLVGITRPIESDGDESP